GKFRPQDENQQLKYRTRVNILKLKIAEQLKNRYKNRDILNSPALLKLIENDNYLIGEIESLVGILDIDTFNSDKK
ncbi:MAG: hypothetical protein L6Q37_13325, partial [Bdellovibrionaceae bacterium]|nr:hypothetical protein [Pseudobdellovibrionaceae bacterium]